jgi:hypothetical protein
MRYDLIKTDNYLLICNDSEIKGYYYDDYIKKVRHSGGAEYVENNITKNIVAHLPLNGAPYLDGVPLLPSISKHYDIDFAEVFYDLLKMTYPTFDEWPEAIEYNKQVREKYKFTEDDMIKFADFKSSNLMKHSDENGMYLGTRKVLELWKSHQQPKLPIAFECEVERIFKHNEHMEREFYDKPKTITNSEERVEWVGKYIW